LPWYRLDVERKRNARTARIVRRSEQARIQADRVINEYRRAEESAGGALVTEIRRPR
jgi:hypothetical protein